MPDNSFKTIAEVCLSRNSHGLLEADCKEALSERLRNDDANATSSSPILDTTVAIMDSFDEAGESFYFHLPASN
jgi:hypothetical protein